MGSRGPIPKRSDQRRRTNAPVGLMPIEHAPGAPEVEIPEADQSWHPIARLWYESLSESGQAAYYEPSDWALAYLIAHSISLDLEPQVVGITETGKVVKDLIPLKGASLSAYLKAFGNLLVTEGDRRRVQLELQRPKEVDADQRRAVATVTDLRSRLRAQSPRGETVRHGVNLPPA